MPSSKKQPKLISYAEYRLREAYDESGDDGSYEEDDWSFESPELADQEPVTDELDSYAPADQGQEWNWAGEQADVSQDDLDTLGMSQRPTFAEMPEGGLEQAAAGGPGQDDDPEDYQAQQDLFQISDVYGLKLGGLKYKDGSHKLLVEKKGLRPFRQEFNNYVDAMRWINGNMDKMSGR